MSRRSPALAEGWRTAGGLSWVCAGAGGLLVGIWCVSVLLSIGRSSPVGQWDVVGATGFAFGMLAVALTVRQGLGSDQQPAESEAPSALPRARRNADASIGIALVGVASGLLLLTSSYALPGIHTQIIWFSDRVPVAAFIILLAVVAASRAFSAAKAVGVSETWLRQPKSNWARTAGLGVTAAYILTYGITLAVGIVFLALFLLFHLPQL